MPNRLEREKSPYLQQHAQNPVDWFPWGEEAFARAAEESKPVFLSIGYATCHWCHVMERESFEDREVADLLNEHFISVKVDREERPDVDRVYMTVCQVLTGRGGWPLSIFMTPDGKAFYAGSYFPKSARMGMPGFMDIARQVAELWRNDRERLQTAGNEIARAIQPGGPASSAGVPGVEMLGTAWRQLRQSYDAKWGGFGTAPKFPTPHHLTFLLRWHWRDPGTDALFMVEKTLDAMRDGGIFDHVGFGFHRYSVDRRWLVPHFEKMLYDQAMLAVAYTEAFQATGKAVYADVAGEIFEYVLRDMQDAGGGFYSAEDADSEGREGLFYVWTPEQVRQVLGEEDGDIFCRFYDIGSPGNFEDGFSIPHVPRPLPFMADRLGLDAARLRVSLDSARKKLFSARTKRIPPLKDDKILTSWNGLMIAALAKGFQALRNPRYVRAASRAAAFILENLKGPSGRLSRRYRHAETAHPGYADDYAFLIWGLIELYESTFDVGWLEQALALQDTMLDLFWDDEDGGFFYTPKGGESLIVRDKEIYDGAVPSSNSIGALNLLRLGRMTGNPTFEQNAGRLMEAFSGMVAEYPSAYTQFLNAVDFALGPGREIVICGDSRLEETRHMLEMVHKTFHPNQVLLFKDEGAEGERLGRICEPVQPLHPSDGGPAAYICEGFACRQPITAFSELEKALAPEDPNP